MKVSVTITLGISRFETNFTLDKDVPAYVIADEAYRLALIYAETQYIARYGHNIVMHEFAEMLKELDYTYSINGVKIE